MDNIIKSFTLKPSLSEDLWINNTSEDFDEVKLHGEIRDKLISTTKDFIDSIGLDTLVVEDVIIVGSTANYNWSKYSDIDLHVLIDKDRVSDNELLADEFFTAKKELYNIKHDIKVKGFDVELYPQDVKESVDSDGIYSVLYNKWLKTPTKKSGPESIDKKSIIKKVNDFHKKLDNIKKEVDPEAKILMIDKLKAKIRVYRKSGLTNSGEYGTENLVFKYLRRSGYLEELRDLGLDTKDQSLSLENEIY